jgi:hypothetical protein
MGNSQNIVVRLRLNSINITQTSVPKLTALNRTQVVKGQHLRGKGFAGKRRVKNRENLTGDHGLLPSERVRGLGGKWG